MVKSKIDKKIASLEKRIHKLEKVVFDKNVKIQSNKKYKGLVGGIHLLIDKRHFNKLVSPNEVYEKLKKTNYIYPLSSVDKILRVDFFKKKKLLARTKEGGVWKYALRK